MTKASKRERFSSLSASLASVPAAAQKGSADDQTMEYLNLIDVTPDPENPRRIGFDLINPRAISNEDPDRDRKARVLAEIEDLAISIAQLGLIEPVTVYRHGPTYRLVSGERRYWASKLAGLKTIKAIPLPARPDNLRELQYAENVQRAGLTAAERFLNVQGIIAERNKHGHPIRNAKDLMDPLAVKQSQAYEWWTLLQAPIDVHEALANDRISSIERAITVSQISDKAKREIAIATGELPIASRMKTRNRGRPAQTINLGRAESVDVVRFILEKALGKELPVDVNWSDLRTVSDLFQRTIKLLGTRLAKGENL